MESVLAMWRWRSLTLAGRITIFKTMVFSKVVFISYLSYVPKTIIEKIEQIHKDFIWNKKRPKMKHSSLIGDYEEGGLKDIDIGCKFRSLHLCWIKRMFDNNFHPWKNLPKAIFNQFYGIEVFFPNTALEPPPNTPLFYKNMIEAWNSIEQEPLTP